MFDFSKLSDLNLSPEEEEAVEHIYQKCRSTLLGPWKMSQQQLIEQFIRGIISCREFGMVASVVAAQGIIEGAWFEDEDKGILFGIKARKSDVEAGVSLTTPTHEDTTTGVIKENDAFFVGSMENQFKNLMAYMVRMKPLFKSRYFPNDIQGYLDYLESEPPYSTETAKFGDGYYETVTQVIHTNGLYFFDHA